MGRPFPRVVATPTGVAQALNGSATALPRVVLVALTLLLAGCATSRAPARPPTPKALPATIQTGVASWYGRYHQGRRTASGEVYDMRRLTAAHPTLPLGTLLLVTNLKNDRSVTVRVNDRGPDVAGRSIDLSYAAATELRAIHDGTIPVRIQVLSAPP
jgi:peptidoglycan lytic transglycosylase